MLLLTDCVLETAVSSGDLEQFTSNFGAAGHFLPVVSSCWSCLVVVKHRNFFLSLSFSLVFFLSSEGHEGGLTLVDCILINFEAEFELNRGLA